MLIRRELNTYNPSVFIPALKDVLEAHGFHGDHVIIRDIQADRVEIAASKGTDRDANSTLYDIAQADSNAATRKSFGIPDEAVTYAHDLLVSTDHPVITNTGEPVLLENQLESLEPQGLGFGSAYLIYDPSRLQKAPDAQVEYWFHGNPSDALLGIITHTPKPVQHDPLKAEIQQLLS